MASSFAHPCTDWSSPTSIRRTCGVSYKKLVSTRFRSLATSRVGHSRETPTNWSLKRAPIDLRCPHRSEARLFTRLNASTSALTSAGSSNSTIFPFRNVKTCTQRKSTYLPVPFYRFVSAVREQAVATGTQPLDSPIAPPVTGSRTRTLLIAFALLAAMIAGAGIWWRDRKSRSFLGTRS